MKQPFNPFRQGTAEEQMASQVHKTAPTPGEAEDLFAGWGEDSPCFQPNLDKEGSIQVSSLSCLGQPSFTC